MSQFLSWCCLLVMYCSPRRHNVQIVMMSYNMKEFPFPSLDIHPTASSFANRDIETNLWAHLQQTDHLICTYPDSITLKNQGTKGPFERSIWIKEHYHSLLCLSDDHNPNLCAFTNPHDACSDDLNCTTGLHWYSLDKLEVADFLRPYWMSTNYSKALTVKAAQHILFHWVLVFHE